MVTVRSRRGEAAATADVGEEVAPGQVFMPMHFVETNMLTFPVFDPYSNQPDYKYAVAVDMPRVDRHSLSRLIDLRRPERDATAYRGSDGIPEPLCCIYEPSIAARIAAAASTGMWSLRSVLREVDVALVDPEQPGLTESMDSRADVPDIP